ncbi:MAG TPA: TonB family protein [Longimicrobium sp.]|nr:TonB family protein [Longimicrobium sp.]
MRLARRWIAFACLATHAASAAAQEPTGPPLSELVDSAALVQALAAIPPLREAAGVPPLFQVSVDTAGGAEVEPSLSQIPAPYAEPVVAAIRAHLRPQARSPRGSFMFLRAVAGPRARVERVFPLMERPALEYREHVGEMMKEVIETRRGAWDRLRYDALLRMRVTSAGTVDSVILARSTGDPDLDTESLRLGRRMSFTPGSLEGVRATMWAMLPLTFDTRSAARVRGFNSDDLKVLLYVFLPSDMGRDTTAVQPQVGAMVDSAALVRALAALPPADHGVEPVFRIRLGADGGVLGIEPVFDALPAADAEQLVTAIRANLKPQPLRNQPIHTYLRAVSGPAAVVDRPALAERGPVLINHHDIMRMMSEVARRHPGRGPVLTQYQTRILADGTPDSPTIEVVRSSGNAALDAAVMQVLGRMRFRPATIDGTPVKSWVWMPTVLRFL